MGDKSDKMPLVSVIMPTYNCAEFIADAIKSVLEQNYQQLELIIIDNYSDDNTEQIVASFVDPRIKYYKYHNEGIIAKARNYGVSLASGEIIAFLDADDVWLSHKLDAQLPLLETENIVAVSSNFIPISEAKYHYNFLIKLIKNKYKDFSYEEVILANPVITSSLITRKSDFDKVGGFDESREFCFIEDWELWLRLSCKERMIRVLREPLLSYRITRKSGRNVVEILERTLGIVKKHEGRGSLTKSTLRSAYGNCYLCIAREYLELDGRKALSYSLKGLWYSQGLHNKLRGLFGIVLSVLPLNARNWFLNKFYYKK